MDGAEDLLHVLRTRCVTRRFTPEPIDAAALNDMLEAMLTAPSAGNTQAWAYVVVRRPAPLRRLTAFCPGIRSTPAVAVVACVDHERLGDDPGGLAPGAMCIAMAVQNLLLAAHALGLGGCPTASFQPAAVRVLLELPPHLEPVLIATLGHPAHELRHRNRRTVDEVVHHETW
ncbi:nitroreductase family protein [Streptomyces sp. LP05-1]|uniref:Nitroreductase family protein n=1 Tax=Streptomyces pyxinae TaxID=2970734 RepID=A0ABT2CJF7_9ACTN|nr:nitroreductase family protein [Streptomyces sp. LP05-1]MCS0637542.1 nitroreductase family protein [Streptomyces sp. LP05-1]